MLVKIILFWLHGFEFGEKDLTSEIEQRGTKVKVGTEYSDERVCKMSYEGSGLKEGIQQFEDLGKNGLEHSDSMESS